MKCGNSWVPYYVLLSSTRFTKGQFVDSRQLCSVNGSMWSVFEESNASLFTLYVISGLACLLLIIMLGLFFFFLTRLLFLPLWLNSDINQPCYGLVLLCRLTGLPRRWYQSENFLAGTASEREFIWGHVPHRSPTDWQLGRPIGSLAAPGRWDEGVSGPRASECGLCRRLVELAASTSVTLAHVSHLASFDQALHLRLFT